MPFTIKGKRIYSTEKIVTMKASRKTENFTTIGSCFKYKYVRRRCSVRQWLVCKKFNDDLALGGEERDGTNLDAEINNSACNQI